MVAQPKQFENNLESKSELLSVVLDCIQYFKTVP